MRWEDVDVDFNESAYAPGAEDVAEPLPSWKVSTGFACRVVPRGRSALIDRPRTRLLKL